MLGHRVGEALSSCEWVGVVFAGGMAEVPHIKARTIVVNDKHRAVINLALTVGSTLKDKLIEVLDVTPFHPDALALAQQYCLNKEREQIDFLDPETKVDFTWAVNYFITAWMGRSALSGTDGEFNGGLPIRWEPGGGDSNVRYRSAIESLDAWGVTMRRCNFSTLDFRDFLAKCKDRKKHAIYSDAPFPDAGGGYKHKFTEQDQRDLARLLAGYREARVVCRFYDHPLIRECYPETFWTWNHLEGRKQTNDIAPEVLLVSRPLSE